MKSIEESVVTAMDGTDTELFPFIPYILQDSWEIGADPEVIIRLIIKHKKKIPDLRVLDLGCGKGAVTVKIAHKLNCMCHGIDAFEVIIKARTHNTDGAIINRLRLRPDPDPVYPGQEGTPTNSNAGPLYSVSET